MILLYAFWYVIGFTMEILIPNPMQYLCKYASIMDLVCCADWLDVLYDVIIQFQDLPLVTKHG